MIAAILILAEIHAMAPRMSLLPGQGNCYAYVHVINSVGNYNAIEDLETEHGLVRVSYQTVGGHNDSDHDLVRVYDLPDGVVAAPVAINLADGDEADICLMQMEVS